MNACLPAMDISSFGGLFNLAPVDVQHGDWLTTVRKGMRLCVHGRRLLWLGRIIGFTYYSPGLGAALLHTQLSMPAEAKLKTEIPGAVEAPDDPQEVSVWLPSDMQGV